MKESQVWKLEPGTWNLEPGNWKLETAVGHGPAGRHRLRTAAGRCAAATSDVGYAGKATRYTARCGGSSSSHRELHAAHAALDSVREEAAAVGRQLLPLRSPAELMALLQSELLYPLGTPKRSYRVLMELRARGVVVPSQFELDLLLSRLHVNDEWKLALRNMTVPTE